MATPTRSSRSAPLRAIDRRTFLTWTMAAGAAGAIPGAVTGARAQTPAPKRGGRLRIGVGGASTSDTLDPQLLTDIMAPVVAFGQLRNCLVEIDADWQAVPELAIGWEPSPDARLWTFKLRQGVEFHNGKTLDADDVVYSINLHRGEDTKSVVNSLLRQIEDVKADGRDTVVFTLQAGNADFPYILADNHVLIVPAGTTAFDEGVGTGGYMLIDWEPGIRALTRRNPNYWKAGRAHFDEVETLAINDVTARTNALQTGAIDVMNRCERKTAHLLGERPELQLVVTTGSKHYTIPMRTDRAPFDDNQVRLALKHAIDRAALLERVLRGYGELGNDHPISPHNRYYAQDLPQRTYDPDRTRFHLKQAGYDRLSVRMHAADVAFEGAVDTAVLYKQHAAAANIDIEVVREPNDGYWSNVWMSEAFTMSYWSGRPTEDWMLTEAYAAGSNWNETFWRHERFNELLEAARSELDEDRRREMYGELQRLVRDEGGAVIPLFAADLHAASTKLATPAKVAADRELDGYRIAERWWFA